MKTVIRAGALALAISSALTPQRAEATGFPVIDIASIVQAVTDYSTQLTQYAEMIQQGAQQGLMLVEEYRKYEHMVEEYMTTLNNLKDLSEYINEGDMRAAFKLITNSNLSEYVAPEFKNLADELLDVWVAVDLVRSTKFGGIDDVEKTLKRIDKLYRDSPNAVAQAELIINYQNAYTSRAAVNESFNEQVSGFERNIAKQEEKLNSLGAESEVATLQAIGNILISQQKISVAAMRKESAADSASVSIEEIVARKQAEALEQKLIRAESITSNRIEYKD